MTVKKPPALKREKLLLAHSEEYLEVLRRVGKGEIFQEMFKFGIGSDTLADDNQVDAYGLAHMGMSFLNWYDTTDIKYAKYEVEAFKGIPEKCVLL